MKVFLFIFLAIIATDFASCSSDDGNKRTNVRRGTSTSSIETNLKSIERNLLGGFGGLVVEDHAITHHPNQKDKDPTPLM